MNFLKCLKIIGFLIFFITTHVTANIPKDIDGILNKYNINEENIAITAFSLNNTNKKIIHNGSRLFNPASIMKLVTTSAALEILGSTYTWKTSIYHTGEVVNGTLNGDLYIKGGGDPKLNMEKLWLMLREIKLSGITNIKGSLILDDTYFVQPKDWEKFVDDQNDNTKPYLTSPHSLFLNFNAVRVVSSNKSGNIKIQLEPAIDVKVINKVSSTKGKNCQAKTIRFSVNNNNKNPILTVTGNLNIDCTQSQYISSIDQNTLTYFFVRSLWTEIGGIITGTAKLGKVPGDAKLLLTNYSPDLHEVIKDINKWSNNPMAKQVFLTIGRNNNSGALDDRMAARLAIESWLRNSNINMSGLFIENGSGLSRQSKVSSDGMASMLQHMYKGFFAAEFISSLPIIGKDGTMKKRLNGTTVEGRGHIKTGTLRNVNSIAGYTRDKSGDVWVVVAMINVNTRNNNGTDILDQILLAIYNY